MKKTRFYIILISLIPYFASTGFSFAQTWNWFLNAQTNGVGIVGLYTDSLGNRYAGGTLDSLIIIGTTLQTDSSFGAAYIIKFDTAGQVVWYNLIETSDYIHVNDMVVAKDGTSYIGGETRGNIQIDNVIYNSIYTSGFICKINSDGSCAWLKYIGGSITDKSTILDIAIDANQNTYTCGFWDSTALSMIHYGPFIMKLDSAGNEVWSNRSKMLISNLNWACFNCYTFCSISLDNFNNLYTSGLISNSPILYGLIGTDTIVADDCFISSFDINGNYRFTNNYSKSISYNLKNLPTGELIADIAFNDSVIIAGTTYYANQPQSDLALLYIDSMGNCYDGIVFSGKGQEGVQAIDIDLYGNIVLTGSYSDTLRIDSAHINPYDSVLYKYDIFLLNINPYLNHLNWFYSFGGDDEDYSASIHIDHSNNIYIAGVFRSTSCDFGSMTVPNNAGQVLYLAELQSPILSSTIKDIDRSKFRIFPVPTSAKLNIDVSEIEENVKEINIKNILGQTVLKVNTINDKLEELDVKKLNSGIYMVEVITKQNTLVKKFIKL
ncbi:MAG: T9SS type A sorting domain-containing protein [Bacteroidota bacterium]